MPAARFTLYSTILLLIVAGCGKNESSTPPPSLSKNNFVVAIDIGHTREIAGATSARGTKEFYYNQNIAVMLRNQLVASGFEKCFIINESGDSIGLKQRTQIAADNNAHVFVSIHHDSVQPKYLEKWNHLGKEYFYSDRFSGFSLFISAKNPDSAGSYQLADNVADAFLKQGLKFTRHHNENIPGENRPFANSQKGIYLFDDLVVLKTASMPALLVECGILVNRKEEETLSSTPHQKKLVLALAQGITAFWQKGEN